MTCRKISGRLTGVFWLQVMLAAVEQIGMFSMLSLRSSHISFNPADTGVFHALKGVLGASHRPTEFFKS